jgi:hypothetical protein
VTFPNEYRARWQGVEYEASPDGEAAVRLYTDVATPGFEQVRPGRHRRVVPRREVDWFGYVRTVGALTIGEMRDLPVLVLVERGSDLLVQYLGGLAPVAEAAGLTRMEPGVYQGWVRRAEVDGIQQVRTP